MRKLVAVSVQDELVRDGWLCERRLGVREDIKSRRMDYLQVKLAYSEHWPKAGLVVMENFLIA
jgi:hypothetical protein